MAISRSGRLEKGLFTSASKQKRIEIIKNLQHQGAQGATLGCTELPILVSEIGIDTPIFDTGKIHAPTALEWSLQN